MRRRTVCDSEVEAKACPFARAREEGSEVVTMEIVLGVLWLVQTIVMVGCLGYLQYRIDRTTSILAIVTLMICEATGVTKEEFWAEFKRLETLRKEMRKGKVQDETHTSTN